MFFNKAWTKINNHISPYYRPKEVTTFGERVRQFLLETPVDPPGRPIDVAPFPTHIDEKGIAHFADNGSEEYQRIKNQVIKPDIIVFATGYLQSFPFLESKKNTGRKPYPRADEADVREVWKRDDPTVSFIGFVRPGFGAIPPLSELQVMLWITNLLGQVKKPLVEDDQWHYRLIAPPEARLSYGVEHDSYAFQLAADMDAVAGFTDIARLSLREPNGRFWRLPWIWAGSTNFTVKFRLIGPWAWRGAADVMTDDLWEVISRREGLFGKFPFSHDSSTRLLTGRKGNFTLFVMPALQLGPVHLFYFLYALIIGFLAMLGLAKPLKPVSVPKMKIQELQRRHEKLKGLSNGMM